jgi:hypothetical protein
MILKYFRQKNRRKMAYLTQNKTKLNYEKMITTLVFEKNAIFFAENWRKSRKIMIKTSVPDGANFRRLKMVCFDLP